MTEARAGAGPNAPAAAVNPIAHPLDAEVSAGSTMRAASWPPASASPASSHPSSSSSPPATTALMRQYLDVKARYPDAIVFFRLGDFYEMFYEDAIHVAGALGLTLTTRDKGKEHPVPMCGIPHHAARGYLAKLTELGHRIAICEQLEDPRSVRGIVKRDVVRVVTPGVIVDEESLDPRAPNHLAAVRGDARQGYGLAFIDVTTGSFRGTEVATLESLIDELSRAEPREIVVRPADSDLATALRRACPRTPVTTSSVVEPDRATRDGSLPPRPWAESLVERAPVAVAAAVLALGYARATQPAASLPPLTFEYFRRSDTLVIDEQARAHLELTETLLERKRRGSLLDLLDQSRSAMGGRLLRRWLLFPSVDVATIRRRQDAVERLVSAHAARDEARRVLGEVGDLERQVGRARLGVATPRDLAALGAGLSLLPELARALEEAALGEIPTPPPRSASPSSSSPVASTSTSMSEADAAPRPAPDLASLGDDLCGDIVEEIARTLRPDVPPTAKDGGFVRPGFSEELDEWVAMASGGRAGLAAIEARERTRTGIASLKIKSNNVFGYYIEVTRAQMDRVPADYVRKQTIANAERFVTPELAEYESKILTADERRIALELAIFTALRSEVARQAERLLALAARVAVVDALAGLAEVAHRGGFARPLVDDSALIDIEDGRHPVVESWAAGAGGFVPNDVRLDPAEAQILIVTGPNMAGKSTLIRQVALTVILAQMGSFVPARRAHIGLCDRVFTRVGAGDNLARGESTFLVEMRETAHILRHATARSLVVLDEIGRGTSTYDGVSIAWAVAEFLHQSVGAKTLFATHYHELCGLADSFPRVRNVSVAAREWQGEVIFLRKLTPGGASRSFGVEVAKLAGLPASVITKAQSILVSLESTQHAGLGSGIPRRVAPAAHATTPQLALFSDDGGARGRVAKVAAEIVGRLETIDPDEMTPRQALDLITDLKNKLRC